MIMTKFKFFFPCKGYLISYCALELHMQVILTESVKHLIEFI